MFAPPPKAAVQKAPPVTTPAPKPTPAPVVQPKIKPVVAIEPNPIAPPIRCTHYLSREISARISVTQGKLITLTTLRKRNVSNSNIVEAALRLAFDDLEQSGIQSRFVQMLQTLADEQRLQGRG